MNNLNLVPITELQALRIAQDRHSPSIYADKHAQVKLKFLDKLNIFVEAENPLSAPPEPYYIAQISPATRTYLQPGKWDSSKLQRHSLTAAAQALRAKTQEINLKDEISGFGPKGPNQFTLVNKKATTLQPQFATLTALDILQASPIQFLQANPIYGKRTLAMLNGTIADLFKLASANAIPCTEVNISITANRAFRFGDYLIYASKSIAEQERHMHLTYGK